MTTRNRSASSTDLLLAAVVLAAFAIRIGWQLVGVLAWALGEIICVLAHQTEIVATAVYSRRAVLRAATPAQPDTTQPPSTT
jgi:hypothetical protein